MRGRVLYIYIVVLTTCIVLSSGCNKLRDLYVIAVPQIYVEGDWEPSLGLTNMSMNATAIAYSSTGEFVKEYFFNADNTTLPVTAGTFDVMIFNGLMYSAENTHLDEIYFRGIEALNSFEAVVKEGTPSKRLVRAESEYIASNDMEIITSAVGRQEIDSDNAYCLKYQDGKNGTDMSKDYIKAELYMTPLAVSYECQVVVTVNNISSAWSASAALYGFVGSAFLGTRMPSHFYVTHQFLLNDKIMLRGPENGDRGTIRSPMFVTFGPPIDAPENRYSIYFNITLVDGSEFKATVDITDQVKPIIEAIRANIEGGGEAQYQLMIPLELTIDLPEVDPIEGSIGVGDWDDDEIIRVPITVDK